MNKAFTIQLCLSCLFALLVSAAAEADSSEYFESDYIYDCQTQFSVKMEASYPDPNFIGQCSDDEMDAIIRLAHSIVEGDFIASLLGVTVPEFLRGYETFAANAFVSHEADPPALLDIVENMDPEDIMHDIELIGCGSKDPNCESDGYESESPTADPSATPSASPSASPSESLAPSASTGPSDSPSLSIQPSSSPAPSGSPSHSPSARPSVSPSASPSSSPSSTPSWGPSSSPSDSPGPSASPSAKPSQSPSASPSETPSYSPSWGASSSPSDSPGPSASPSAKPSQSPSASPSETPSYSPSQSPSQGPSDSPSESPNKSSSDSPSEHPSRAPSEDPSLSPSASPSDNPSGAPTSSPIAYALARRRGRIPVNHQRRHLEWTPMKHKDASRNLGVYFGNNCPNSKVCARNSKWCCIFCSLCPPKHRRLGHSKCKTVRTKGERLNTSDEEKKKIRHFEMRVGDKITQFLRGLARAGAKTDPPSYLCLGNPWQLNATFDRHFYEILCDE